MRRGLAAAPPDCRDPEVRTVPPLEVRGRVLLQLPLRDAALRARLGVPLVAQPAGGAAGLGVVDHHVLVAVRHHDGVGAALLELLDAVQDAAARRPQLQLLDQAEERDLLAVVAGFGGVGRHREGQSSTARAGARPRLRRIPRRAGRSLATSKVRVQPTSDARCPMTRRAAAGLSRLLPLLLIAAAVCIVAGAALLAACGGSSGGATPEPDRHEDADRLRERHGRAHDEPLGHPAAGAVPDDPAPLLPARREARRGRAPGAAHHHAGHRVA